MKKAVLSIVVILTANWLIVPMLHARELTFEDRVRAQESIERIYYSHQLGATKRFEQVLPGPVIEQKVREYLDQTVALDVYWKTPITAEMLDREVQRMARQTRMPERLRELFSALGDDPVLIRECLARPALAGRLARSFFASDERIHGAARERAEALRLHLASGFQDPFADHPNRTLLRFTPRPSASDPGKGAGALASAGTARKVELSPEEFAELRRSHTAGGEVGAVREERDRFFFDVILDERPDDLLVARFAIGKRTWDDWWTEVGQGLVEHAAAVTVAEGARLDSGGDEWSGSVALGGQPPPPCFPDDTWDAGSLGVPGAGVGVTVWTGSLMFLHKGGFFSYRYDPATDTWTPTATSAASMGGTAVWTGEQMIVWGNGGGRYDPVNDSWTPVSTTNAPENRSGHTAVWTGTKMLVWGGLTSGGVFLNTGGEYNPATNTWTAIPTADAPSARGGHTAVWTGNRMVVWGGYRQGAGYLDTGSRYDPSTGSWKVVQPAGAPSARRDHTAVWTGSRMIVWGGVDGTAYLNTGGRYDPVANNWEAVSTSAAPEARGYHTAVWTGSRMIVWGGLAGNPGVATDTGGRYDPIADIWLPTPTVNAPGARFEHTAVWTGSLMIVWGGRDSIEDQLSYTGTGGRYDPLADSWTPTASASGPQGVGSPSVWTGSRMVVWNGDEGGRYDPATDTWSPVSAVGAPTAVGSAVWAGDQMIVWGQDSGGRYDLATDAWTSVSTAGAPDLWCCYTAVWTGDRMVVWGGSDSPLVLHGVDTGRRYDPETDTWQPTSTVNAPVGRYLHTAVWTGDRMIVWGGSQNSNNVLDTGGQYDPATDAWTATSTVGAPSASNLHTAVWTGSRMVVWGGGFPTGGRYDPVSDTWEPTALTNAPSERVSHTAVWTGSRMVVWGGRFGSYTNTGGRYDPVADTWAPTSTVGAPDPRGLLSALWTGSFMVVWGGSQGGSRYALDQADDIDGDGLSACEGDCAPADPGTFALPGEVTGLSFAADKTTLSWESAAPGAGSGTLHDVVRGAVGEFPVGVGPAETCLASVAAATTSDTDTPGAGAGFWYLVRGRNVCGDGSYGSESGGAPRETSVCP